MDPNPYQSPEAKAGYSERRNSTNRWLTFAVIGLLVAAVLAAVMGLASFVVIPTEVRQQPPRVIEEGREAPKP